MARIVWGLVTAPVTALVTAPVTAPVTALVTTLVLAFVPAAGLVGAGCGDGSAAVSVCGDGICDADETPQTCAFDCEICVVDGVCDGEWGEDRVTCPDDCPLCNDDGVCEFLEGEDGLNCPGDCLPAGCDLSTITPQGSPAEYLVSAFRVPTSASEAGEVGVDLDGDGTIDNRLGEVVGMFASQADPNSYINYDIANGDMVLLGRFYVDQYPDDDLVLIQLFEGVPTADPPTFDGTDVLRLAPDYPKDLFLCGELSGGLVDAGPGTLLVPFPLPGLDTVFVTVHQTRMEGEITADSWTDMMVGGGITRGELETTVLPAVADYLNRVIEGDPEGDTAGQLLGFFDGQCSDLVEGCEGVTPEEGECVYNEPTEPGPWITVTEVRCNLLFDGVMQPDVDSNGDGVADLVSLGIRVDAVHATIDEL